MLTSILVALALATIPAAQTPTILSLLQSQPDLSNLTDALLLVPALASILAELTDITILAPTNAAFDRLFAMGLTAESQAVETQDPDGISTLLAYHVLNATYNSSSFTEVPTFYNTIFNQSYSIFGTVRTNVTQGQNVGLVLNGANATIISGELMYSNVVEADITTVPGVTVHKIDAVLTIPLNLSDSLVRLVEPVGTSAALGVLEIANLIERTGEDGETSLETLDTIEDLTIFIPNDEAFIAAASAFENASIDTLRSVLEYHAVTGSVVFASDVTNTTVASVAGQDLTLSVVDGTVFVNGAKVILPNILLSNGVMHIIDTVLNPNGQVTNLDDLNPTASPTPAFSGASAVGTNVPFTESALQATTTNIIPPIATTAQFVSGSSTASGTATVSSAIQTFTGAAGKARMSTGLNEMVLGMAAFLLL